MGSVVVSDAGPDITRYPQTMVVASFHEQHPTEREKKRSSSGLSQGAQTSVPPYTQQRFPAAATTTPASASGSFATPSRPSSRSSLAATPHAIPAAQASAPQRAIERVPVSTPHSEYAAAQLRHHREEDGFDRSGFPLTSQPRGLTSSPPPPRLLPTLRSSLSLSGSMPGSPSRIKVRDLSHIHSFASEDVLTRSQHGSRPSLKISEGGHQYEISAMPVTDIIEMVAGLLTKITTTNDRQHQHEHIHRHIPTPEGSSAVSQQTASVLSFHGKNVPNITILSYLSRIHKYCPTTYEVFLSLLVYFDKMTEMVNKTTLKSFRSAANSADRDIMSPGSTASFHADQVKAQKSTAATLGTPLSSASQGQDDGQGFVQDVEDESQKLSHCFVVDSYNIHRLVIAGVTCASKFFSDVFYTNSRYAKVGGLPVHELNHLELQFLLLNDFRLSVPVEDLEAYGSMLVQFYAEEVMAQQMGGGAAGGASGAGSATDALYMHTPKSTPPRETGDGRAEQR